jgi:hypothetical protein
MIMTARTGLYVALAGMALSAVCTLALTLPGFADPGEPLGGFSAGCIRLLGAGQLFGALLMCVGVVAGAALGRGKESLARAGLTPRPRLHL